MINRGEPPLARLTAVFAVVVAMAACSDAAVTPTPEPDPTPAPAPAPEPELEPAPEPDPLDVLPAEVLATRDALRAAAEAEDWDALGALIPDEEFSSNFGGETDHLEYYRSLGTDVFTELLAVLDDPFVTDEDTTIWPELHHRVPFAFGPDEREALEDRHGADRLANWEAAGQYLGWRVGISSDGAWLFFIAGD